MHRVREGKQQKIIGEDSSLRWELSPSVKPQTQGKKDEQDKKRRRDSTRRDLIGLSKLYSHPDY